VIPKHDDLQKRKDFRSSQCKNLVNHSYRNIHDYWTTVLLKCLYLNYIFFGTKQNYILRIPYVWIPIMIVFVFITCLLTMHWPALLRRNLILITFVSLWISKLNINIISGKWVYVHLDLNVLFMWKVNFEKRKNGIFYEYDNAATPYYQFLLYNWSSGHLREI